MFTEKQKEQIIDYGNKLVESHLTSGTGGNISLYDPQTASMIITPSGFSFTEMTTDDLVTIDLDGNILENKNSNKPSSEWQMHGIFYQEREDIQAIVHAHTIYATVLSCLREPLLPAHYMVALAGKDVRVADYATFGTRELAEKALAAMQDRRAVLLANHGMIAGSSDLDRTFNIVEEIEYCSKIYCLARSIGNPIILSDEEMAKMDVKFQNYGKNAK
ncbi:L-fuculose-phosphate aldolase [Lactovum odontotermitis]